MTSNNLQPDKVQREAIEAQAARLVVLLESSTDPADRDAAHRWIASHPYHAVAYASAADIWKKGERIRLRADDQGLSEEGLAAECGEAPLQSNGVSVVRAPVMSRRAVTAAMLSAAAAAVAGVGISTHFALFGDHRITKKGQREIARLTDGSSISMNGDTSLDVLMDGNSRKVRLLCGEAMFDIARDEKRPFFVDLGDSEIRVLGTKFNIRRKEGVTELAVTEGVVLVTNNGAEPVNVHAGSSAVIRPGIATTLIQDPALVQERVAWTEGFLEFEEKPLDEVVEEFNRYRANPLVIGDPRIAGTLITGRFGLGESDEFVLALESSFDIKASKGGNGSIILMQAD
ncbi:MULTISPECIES: FecR family protein [unclassified Sphingobium]|uniref:FecR family protein n=1 Tax=unclassified Sphingobium TaxID=2611147 RepID=UPI000D15B401|nr:MULTISPECIES: FecR domain-containing protein [unclassified Sphingobium]MBG6116417.1 transmembrane sensor [Sphingobium sp. JAI105]PSO09758.1 transcriptional regulator [Sphingobium sp. AEW4]TWC97738.1 FecR family protein [Sphingobium sp. AEW010]TWD17823.1 FecR family protein [Sphingobium sp. AEW013]TWD20081.1 FecR family protein [Sphingobium sp. AEW001]